MQINCMRHDGRADDSDGKQQRLGVGDLRHEGMECRRGPIDRRNEHLDEVAKADEAHHAADDQLDRPEAKSLEHQDAIGHEPGNDHSDEERGLKQQRKSDGAAEKLGEIGRHRGNLADYPHRQDDRTRKMLAAHFREIAAGHDAELGRKGLEQHRNQIGEQDHPQQAIAVFRARLDVCREVAGIDVGDRRDHRRSGKGQIGAHPAALARQHLTRRGDGPFGERFSPGGDLGQHATPSFNTKM